MEPVKDIFPKSVCSDWVSALNKLQIIAHYFLINIYNNFTIYLLEQY